MTHPTVKWIICRFIVKYNINRKTQTGTILSNGFVEIDNILHDQIQYYRNRSIIGVRIHIYDPTHFLNQRSLPQGVDAHTNIYIT